MSTIPEELLEQLERGNVLLFVGQGINDQLLPTVSELAQELAERCEYKDELRHFPRVAGYYEMVQDRHSLIRFLRERLDTSKTQPSLAHRLIAHLKPRMIVTTCYDRLLERALGEAKQPFVTVVGNAEIAFLEQNRTVLLWVWGVLDRPKSLVITEDDYRSFLDDKINLSDVLRSELARRTWLFVGFDLEDQWFRDFYDTVQRGLDRYGRRAYAFGAIPGNYTRLWWEKRNVSILHTRTTDFLQALVEQLEARKRPEEPAAPLPAKRFSTPLPTSPYKRLDYYRPEDSAIFFGREQDIERLAALIHAHRLVLLFGASGTGKTSLLQAGVIPRLEHSEPKYVVISVRAFEDLKLAICHAIIRQLAKHEKPFSPADTLLETLEQATDLIGPLVIVIDQFEEFFIHFALETRSQIIDELAQLVEASYIPVKLLFSLREDYFARMDELASRIRGIFHIRLRLEPLTAQQTREAIIGPVELLGKRYEPALVERLLTDLSDEGTMPPQLQLVCSTLYDHLLPREKKITLAKYEELGGAAGILKEYLVGELARFGGQERKVARGILKELVDSRGTKTVRTVEALSHPLNVPTAQIQSLLNKMVGGHLLRILDLEESGQQGYELAHEYLISEIASWFDALESERKRLYELLQQDMERWQEFQIPIEGPTLDMLAEHWDEMNLSPTEHQLILRSAVQRGWQIEQWVGQLGSLSGSIVLLRGLLRMSDESIRRHAVQAWRYMPPNSSATVRLIETALDDKSAACRSEAAVYLAHRNPSKSVELILNSQSEVSHARNVMALAHIWDETELLGDLPRSLHSRIVLALASIRLKRAARTLLFFSLSGIIASILIGILFAIAGPTIILRGQNIPLDDIIAVSLVIVPWAISLPAMITIWSALMPLLLFKQPTRQLALLSSSVLAGTLLSPFMLVPWAGGSFKGAWWMFCLDGFVIGSVLGGSAAELFYRKWNDLKMPSLLVVILLTVSTAFLVGTITASFPQPHHNNLVAWSTLLTIVCTVMISGIYLAIASVNRFIELPFGTQKKGDEIK